LPFSMITRYGVREMAVKRAAGRANVMTRTLRFATFMLSTKRRRPAKYPRNMTKNTGASALRIIDSIGIGSRLTRGELVQEVRSSSPIANAGSAIRGGHPGASAPGREKENNWCRFVFNEKQNRHQLSVP